MLFFRPSFPLPCLLQSTSNKDKYLLPEQLTVPSAFHFLGPNGFSEDKLFKRGVVVATTSTAHTAAMRMFDVANVSARCVSPRS